MINVPVCYFFVILFITDASSLPATFVFTFSLPRVSVVIKSRRWISCENWSGFLQGNGIQGWWALSIKGANKIICMYRTSHGAAFIQFVEDNQTLIDEDPFKCEQIVSLWCKI